MSLNRYEQFIDKAIKSAQKDFELVIQSTIQQSLGALSGDSKRFINVSVAEQTARDLLSQSGYNGAVNSFLNDSFNASIDRSFEFLAQNLGGEFRFTNESISILDSIKEVNLSQFGQIENEVVLRTGRAFNQFARGGMSKQDFLNQITADLENLDKSIIKTQVDTAFSAYNRQVTQRMSTDAGFTIYEYVGPLDDITRPFCRDVLSGKHGSLTKTLDEWNQLNSVPSRSGQPSPVSDFQGGYNCRHTLVPVE